MTEMTEFQKMLLELGRPVDIQHIDFRVQAMYQDNGRILAYKDARYDMKILDEVVGPENWQRKHEEINGTIYCSVGIRNPDTGEWIWKQDAGSESQTEAEKGAASDSFKRACFNWGIGRELYDFPTIYIKIMPDEKKLYPNSFKWGMERNEAGEITILGCRDKKNRVRFTYKTDE
jgi:hypothetical protein